MSYSGEGMPGYQPENFTTPPHGIMYDQRGSNFSGIYDPLPSMEPETGQVLASPDPGAAVWNQPPVQSPSQASFQRPDSYGGGAWSYGTPPNNRP